MILSANDRSCCWKVSKIHVELGRVQRQTHRTYLPNPGCRDPDCISPTERRSFFACGIISMWEFAGRTEAGRHVVSRRRCQSSRRTLKTTPKRGPHRGVGSSGYLRRFCMLTAAHSPLIKPYRSLPKSDFHAMRVLDQYKWKVIEEWQASCPKDQLSVYDSH